MKRSRPVIAHPVSREILLELGDFVDAQESIRGFAIIDSSRIFNDADPDQGHFFAPTTKHDVHNQGLETGTHIFVADRATGELDIVPPLPDVIEHNRILNLAAGMATLAIDA